MQAIFRRAFRPPTDWQDFLDFGYAVLAKVVASGCVHTVCHAIDLVSRFVDCNLGVTIEHLIASPHSTALPVVRPAQRSVQSTRVYHQQTMSDLSLLPHAVLLRHAACPYSPAQPACAQMQST